MLPPAPPCQPVCPVSPACCLQGSSPLRLAAPCLVAQACRAGGRLFYGTLLWALSASGLLGCLIGGGALCPGSCPGPGGDASNSMGLCHDATRGSVRFVLLSAWSKARPLVPPCLCCPGLSQSAGGGQVTQVQSTACVLWQGSGVPWGRPPRCREGMQGRLGPWSVPVGCEEHRPGQGSGQTAVLTL